MRTHGMCPGCGDERLLPGRDGQTKAICRDCAGITTEMTCVTCGAETERFRKGACARCVVEGDLIAILKPTDPPDLRIKRLIQALVSSQRPVSVYTWTRGAKASQISL